MFEPLGEDNAEYHTWRSVQAHFDDWQLIAPNRDRQRGKPERALYSAYRFWYN